LKEGDVPVNIEARLQDERWFDFLGTRITMHGLYLTGAEVKAGTQQTSIILGSAGLVTQGRGDLDELNVTTKKLDVLGEDSLIYASKLVECTDGISRIVWSDARLILPSLRKLILLAFMSFIGTLSVFYDYFASNPISCIQVLCFMCLCIMQPVIIWLVIIWWCLSRFNFSWILKCVIIIVGVLFMVVVEVVFNIIVHGDGIPLSSITV